MRHFTSFVSRARLVGVVLFINLISDLRLTLADYRGSGERRKLPQRGLGQSPSRKRLHCILGRIKTFLTLKVGPLSVLPSLYFSFYGTKSLMSLSQNQIQ